MTYELPLLVIKDSTKPSSHTLHKNAHPLDPADSFLNDYIETNIEGDPKKNIVDMAPFCADESDKFLRPYTTIKVWRKLPNVIHINKKMVARYQVPKIVEYLDPSTGEIIQASNLRNDPRVPSQIHVGEIQLLRLSLLNSLRKEVREFSVFVLQFRNNRRGVSPEMETLVEWYARLHGKRPSNVRRYVAVLQSAGFLAGESLLSPLFQRTGKTSTSKDHLGEDMLARCKLMKIRIEAKSTSAIMPLISTD